MDDTWIPLDPGSETYRLWSRANAGEVFPDPITPLNASIGFLANIEPGWRLALTDTGMFDDSTWDSSIPHNPIAAFHGFIYLNMSISRLFGVRLGVGGIASATRSASRTARSQTSSTPRPRRRRPSGVPSPTCTVSRRARPGRRSCTPCRQSPGPP